MFSRIFIGNVRKFIRVPSKEIYDSLLYFLQEDLNAQDIKSEEENMLITAKLKGIIKAIGFTVRIRIFPEGEASTIELSLIYKSFLVTAFALLIGIIVLSITLSSIIPFLILSSIILFVLLHNLSSASGAFLNSMNDFLLLLERNHDQKSLVESRKRWQSDLRRPDELYKRLLDKHIKIWHDTYALEYKISEYMKMGLTWEESIRKVAEEEGIY